jgi:hypothetical protein
MKRSSMAMIAGLAFALSAGAVHAQATAGSARYRVDFERTWSSHTHPDDFPLLAHFSPVIGATQAAGYELIPLGGTATPGLEMLCEEGKHQPLDAEIKASVSKGDAGALIETMEPLRDVPQTATTEFTIDAQHPTVTVAAMIAPSPDWCAVAANVPLMKDGKFVDQVSVELIAWDMGTDSATSYRAFDSDTKPRGKISKSESPYFQKNGAPNPVGRVTFTRLP